MPTADRQDRKPKAIAVVTDFPDPGTLREYGYLAMADSVRLAYVLYRRCDALKYPAIVYYSAYANCATPYSEAKVYLDAGYAFLGANVRGSGASEGVYSYYQPIEAEDGLELIDWIGRQPWCNGRVGMVGASYGAHTQIKVAALNPAYLRAIVPVAVEGSEYRDEAVVGGMFNAGLMAEWTYKTQPERARAGIATRLAAGDQNCAGGQAEQQRNRAYEQVLEHPLIDDWWHARTLDEMAEKITIPTLVIHAWQDEWMRPNGAIRLFNALRSSHKRLVLQNGPHRISRRDVNIKEQLRWLDRWVKGEENGVEAEPPVTILWEVARSPDGVSERPGWVTRYLSWPPAAVKWKSLYLTRGGEMTEEAPSVSDDLSQRRYCYPLGTAMFGNTEQFALEPSSIGSVKYRTQVTTSDIAILGSPEVTLYFSVTRSDVDFMFVLTDIDFEGNELFLQRTVLRASLRAVDERASTDWEVVQSFERVDSLVPGEIYEVKLSLSAVGHVLRQGHRLALTVMAPNTIPAPVWAFAPYPEASLISIHHSGLHPSRIRLPIIVGERAQASAPPPGALVNQPVRISRESRAEPA